MKKLYGLVLIIVMVFTMIPMLSNGLVTIRDYSIRGNGPGGGTLPPPPPPEDGGSAITGNRYAVVIGISDYSGDSNDLQYADDDALDWNDYLIANGYTVNLLIDGQATKENILAALQWLADVEKPGDGVVIAYSGHGYYSSRDKISMIISWELTGVTSDEIYAITSTIETEHVYFFDDACNQGTMRNLAMPGWLLAIGSQEKTYTYDGDASMANGIFTYYMMEALYMPTYIIEDASNYAITEFEANTAGDAFLIDSFTGDFYF